METVGRHDLWLVVVGIAAAAWCVGLTLYAIISDSKQKAASLRTVTRSFAVLLLALGDRLRSGDAVPVKHLLD